MVIQRDVWTKGHGRAERRGQPGRGIALDCVKWERVDCDLPTFLMYLMLA